MSRWVPTSSWRWGLITTNHGRVYATLFGWSGGRVTLQALRAGGATLGAVTKVELLGSDTVVTFSQDAQGLSVTPSVAVQPLQGISNQSLASGVRVLRISHDKGWINDDDPGVTAPGWLRRANLGTGDYNSDLTTSDSPGATWSCSFTGSGFALYAPKEPGAGKLELVVDGETRTTVDLSAAGGRQAQQLVAEVKGLPPGEHLVRIINRGPGPVAVDAIAAN